MGAVGKTMVSLKWNGCGMESFDGRVDFRSVQVWVQSVWYDEFYFTGYRQNGRMGRGGNLWSGHSGELVVLAFVTGFASRMVG